jgi:membrane-bound metal-dependent hydrolase YbcI (DUF457 family)
MILTGHLLVGGAIGVACAAFLPWPYSAILALGLGVVSHHLLDLLPHTDAATFWPHPRKVPVLACIVVALEVLLGFSVTGMLFIAQHKTIAFVSGALGGILPDLFDEMPLWQERFRRNRVGRVWHQLHSRLHCASMAEWWRTGLVIDALVVGAGLWFLLAV